MAESTPTDYDVIIIGLGKPSAAYHIARYYHHVVATTSPDSCTSITITYSSRRTDFYDDLLNLVCIPEKPKPIEAFIEKDLRFIHRKQYQKFKGYRSPFQRIKQPTHRDRLINKRKSYKKQLWQKSISL